MTLRIAKDLTLPLGAVTQSIAILARKGSGKSYTARRLAEQVFKAGQQIVSIDPKGDHWGMRSSPDGKSAGLGVLILGGEHGDLPLEPGSGELVAKLVAEERVSVILDLSLFRKSEVAAWATAFLENLYRIKAREAFRTPMMLIVDEADAIAPQKPMKGEERMLGAIEDIVRRGRQRGIGCTLVTQRSAVLNKNVLTQTQVLVPMRTIAPQDLDAMDEWVQAHGTREQRDVLRKSLPSLPVGDAWFWSPGWPTGEGIFQRVHVAPIETFDSGKTPEPGEKRVEPKEKAAVDLAVLRKRMAATVERQEANDPRLLRKRIAELERELAKKPVAAAKVERVVEKPIVAPVDVKRMVVAVEKAERSMQHLEKALDFVAVKLKDVQVRPPAIVPARPVREPIRFPPATPAREHTARTARHQVASGLQAARQKILDALAWAESVGLPSAEKTQLAFLSGASPTSSAYANNLGGLRSAGLIDYPGAGTVALTEQGRAVANVPDAPRTSEELQRAVLSKLQPARARIVQALINAHPRGLTRDELAGTVDASATSSAYANNLGALRSLGIIDYRGGQVVARDVLFLEGR